MRAKRQELRAKYSLPGVVGWGLVALVALMPLHAFLVTWAGEVFGHRALWQSWKELLIAVLGILTLGWVTLENRRWQDVLKQPILAAIGLFAFVSLAITLITRPDLTTAAYGIKTDLEFLVVFGVAFAVASRALKLRAAQALIVSSGLVVAFGLLQIFVLPDGFLTAFGYGPGTIEPYLRVPGVAAERIISTLGGPNQLGAFLIIPICLVTAWFIRRPRWWHGAFLAGALLVEFHTYSRSAWLGLAIGLFITVISQAKKRTMSIALVILTIGSIIGGLIYLQASNQDLYKAYVYHGDIDNTAAYNSSREHAKSLQIAVQEVAHHPFGKGLGTAGPASFHGSSPLITENYYLQLAVEVGIIGLLMFIIITLLLARELWQRRLQDDSAAPLLGVLVGICVINLFLHGWADSTTALVYWTYAGLVLGDKG